MLIDYSTLSQNRLQISLTLHFHFLLETNSYKQENILYLRQEIRNIKKLMIHGELVIEWIKEKSIKDVVGENIGYDQKVAERRYQQSC